MKNQINQNLIATFSNFSAEDKKRASLILQAVDGLSFNEAKWVLSRCAEALEYGSVVTGAYKSLTEI